jgi:hypothetical protein
MVELQVYSVSRSTQFVLILMANSLIPIYTLFILVEVAPFGIHAFELQKFLSLRNKSVDRLSTASL